MKKPLLLVLLLILGLSVFCQPPRTVSDCTITYSVDIRNAQKNSALSNATKTIYIKGKDIRVDLISNVFTQTLFYNANTGEASILKQVGNEKYLAQYSAAEWKNKNKDLTDPKVSLTDNTKTILNYDCKQAIVQLQNGNSYTVYYCPQIILSVIENPFEFRQVPGMILQYEASIKNGEKITFTAQKVNFNPVPIAEFEIPKTGYRILKED